MITDISIVTQNGEEARKVAEALLEGFGGPGIVKRVTLNTKKGIPSAESDYDLWPCVLVCYVPGTKRIFHLSILQFDSGADSLEAQALKEFLKYCGFDALSERVLDEKFEDVISAKFETEWLQNNT